MKEAKAKIAKLEDRDEADDDDEDSISEEQLQIKPDFALHEKLKAQLTTHSNPFIHWNRKFIRHEKVLARITRLCRRPKIGADDVIDFVQKLHDEIDKHNNYAFEFELKACHHEKLEFLRSVQLGAVFKVLMELWVELKAHEDITENEIFSYEEILNKFFDTDLQVANEARANYELVSQFPRLLWCNLSTRQLYRDRDKIKAFALNENLNMFWKATPEGSNIQPWDEEKGEKPPESLRIPRISMNDKNKWLTLFSKGQK